jgi:xylulokinase
MAERLLGIDVGTTGVRAALFDPTGELVANASVACPYASPHPGWAEADPRGWWSAARRALASLGAPASPGSPGSPAASPASGSDGAVGGASVGAGARALLESVACVAVAGQAPTAALVDASGEPVRPAVLWLDTRADAEARELGTEAYYLGPKLLWLARHEPAVIARARFILQSHAFVAQKLTGEAATDPSTAALAIPLFDLGARAWLHAACDRVGVRADQLPPIRRAHDVIGQVTARAAAETGLPAGTPVVAGGGDFAAATLGAGVIDEGEACLMLGTAGNLLVPRRTPGADARLINAHHVGADVWLSLGGTLSGGAQEWLRHAFAGGAAGALPAFDVLDAEAAAVPAGAGGLVFLPYLQGERTPLWDVTARGAYVGLSLEHGRGHLWRALLEGIALSFVDCQSVLEESGVRLTEVVGANGGGKSALFRQILCDALGAPLTYAPRASGTVAGAAVLAGLGAGLLPSASAARAFRGPTLAHAPAPDKTSRYRELLALRRATYGALRPAFTALAPLRAAP